MAHTPTIEQQTIIDAFATGADLVIEAGAGTGKTATLRMLGESTERRGIYLAYNRAIADEASANFPRNVSCSTAHSLAYRAVGKSYKDRLNNSQRFPLKEVARRLGIRSSLVVYDDDEEVKGDFKSITPAQLARLASETVKRFCYSADSELDISHVPHTQGLTAAQNLGLRNTIMGHARTMWVDLQDPHGSSYRFEHDHYLKIWALTEPELTADFILLDEAQDANPVIASIVDSQPSGVQRVLVGDQNQAIYGWRGAVNAMRHFEGQRFYLSQSFRFGPAIAAEANEWLARLEAPLRLSGFAEIESTIGVVGLPDAILCRSNAGAFAEVIAALEDGRRPALVGGGDALGRMASAAQELQNTGRTEHPEFFAFSSWDEVQDYIKEDEAAGDLAVFVRLIDKYGPGPLIKILDRLAPEANADVIISTAHKAKGREWAAVRISDDFARSKSATKPPSREDLMLSYVAITRAKLSLDRGGLTPDSHRCRSIRCTGQ